MGKKHCSHSRARSREVLYESFVSSPDGEYGGWIAVDPIGREHAILIKEFLTKELGPRLYWYISPYDSLVAATGVDDKKLSNTWEQD